MYDLSVKLGSDIVNSPIVLTSTPNSVKAVRSTVTLSTYVVGSGKAKITATDLNGNEVSDAVTKMEN
jgi:hypothetical protein